MCLEAATAEGHLDRETLRALVLPKRRGGRRWEFSERRFLTRAQLGRLLAEIPSAHAPLFVLLASTGLRISEAIALRWCDPAHCACNAGWVTTPPPTLSKPTDI